jgi:hypothetical protein
MEELSSMARIFAPADGEVTKLILEEGKTPRKRAAETMPSTLPLVIRCLSRSSLDKLSIPSSRKIYLMGISKLCLYNIY